MANKLADPNADGLMWTHQFQDEVDAMFIKRVQNSVTQSCALPFALPAEAIPGKIIEAAQWFW